jgi:peptidoglycan L-alanyl-D-glutamate endopeptidase CwlK
MHKTILYIGLFISLPLLAVAQDSLPKGIRALLTAYPDHIKSATKNSIVWKDGEVMPYDDGQSSPKTFEQLLNKPDLEDQFRYEYAALTPATPPARNHDPGRIRYEPFFFKMYGKTKEAVQKQLTTIVWMPKTYGVKLQVTTVNGIDKKLKAISDELDKLPHLHKYVANIGGTFAWRVIAGTNRQSGHSFGSTIDINTEYSHYWRWGTKNPKEDGSLQLVFKNKIPDELVAIFEKQGFIWGGRWYHYDTMHFEYRPELINTKK